MSSYNFDLEIICHFAKDSYTMTELVRLLGGNVNNTRYRRALKVFLKESKITLSGSKKPSNYGRPLSEYLVLNGPPIGSHELKKRLLRANLLNDMCSICGLEGVWNNNPISLHLDHIDGIHNNNNIENLRLLCPNCHSQTETYCGRNNKGRPYGQTVNLNPGLILQEVEISGINSTAKKYGVAWLSIKNMLPENYDSSQPVAMKKVSKPKIDWPSVEELESKLSASNFESVGRELGVTGNAIRKHLKKVKENV